jgi:adenylate cyclase
MTDAVENLARLPAPARPRGAGSARHLYWRLVWIYVQGSVAAVVVTFSLVLLGLELTGAQWLYILSCTPLAVAFYLLPDIGAITWHYRPLGRALAAIERGEQPSREAGSAALARALNLPFYSFVRVTFLHGPMATAALLLVFYGGNLFLDMGFATWQAATFAATILFFAAPTHAIFEYFSISRDMAAPISQLWRLGGEILPEHTRELVAIRLRSKLLYLSIFVAALPLVFFACSIIFKVDLLLRTLGVETSAADLLPLWLWVVGVVLVCMIGALVMSILTAAEVSRSAAALGDAMRRVEQGQLNVDLHVTSTDEYAELYRGFNLMIDGLRDELRMLEVTHDLSGELKLDALIHRIMAATTELLDAERSTLFLYDPKTDELWSSYAEGLETKQIRLPSGRGIAGAVFTTGKFENIHDAYADQRFNPAVDRATGYRTRSILCMPIIGKSGARIGVTQVLNKKSGEFTAKDVSRLRAFAAQIAVSLENAQLFDEVVSVKNYNESILKSTFNGFVTLDTERRVVTANDAALSILGLARDEAVGAGADRFFGGENAWVMSAIERIERGGEKDISVDASLDCGGQKVSVNMTALPLIGLAGASIGSMLVFEDITEEKRVRTTMARYMSKEVADQLLAGGEAELGGKDQTVTILFSDIRHFTTVSEALGARETVSMLNEYFAEMVEVVFHHNGILDKYIGDAMMALFGAPFRRPEDADSAVAVGNDMMRVLASLNARRVAAGKEPIEIGVGMATGEVTVGNIGSPKRMEYTVIGDSVNLASRLEGANKYYGTKILLSESTVRALRTPVPMREIDLIKVKGKDRPIAVYEALGYHHAETFPHLDEALARFGEGLAAYRAMNWAAAIAAFERVLALQPGDAPSEMYVKRCHVLRAAPPAAPWDGIWVLTEK